MLEELVDDQIKNTLSKCEETGVALDYIILKEKGVSSTLDSHRGAALTGMRIIDERLEKWALSRASNEFPIEEFFRIKIHNENINAQKISVNEFWGNDDAFPKEMNGGGCWAVPDASGYKTAFFNPPYGLRVRREEQLVLFDEINQLVLSPVNDENLEIYRWPDDWSNYFDAGKEWWGTFFWTIYNREKSIFIVIGGSTTD